MTSLFGAGKQKVDEASQRAQRKQDQAINSQTADESKELGARQRLIAARASGRNSLFSSSGAAGVKETLG